MHEISNASQAAALLSSYYGGVVVVGVDGRDGVGKTTLARELGESIGATVISLDDFVPEKLGAYVPNLRSNDLASSISSASRPVIVEGVCLLAALEAVSVDADVLIYVKHVAENGYWYDHGTCDPEENEEALISRLSHEADSWAELDAHLSGESEPEEGDFGLTPLREEIVRYHCKYRPSVKAQITFLRQSANK